MLQNPGRGIQLLMVQCIFQNEHLATRAHLKCLVLQVHLEQGVSHHVSEATAVKVTIWSGVKFAVVDLWELQATVLIQVISMEILVLAENLLTKTRAAVCC